MERRNICGLTRRKFIAASLAAPLVVYNTSDFAAAQELEPTPACGDNGGVTPAQTPGPFYKPSSPERVSLLEPGIQGTRIVLEGYVRSTKCKPIKWAIVDFWHADAGGEYDNAGFKLRGHQFTDGAGKYRLETIVPGLYPGRTRHFHVLVQAPNHRVLITQLYFPGVPENRRDQIFNPKLVIAVRDVTGSKAAKFDFVVQA